MIRHARVLANSRMNMDFSIKKLRQSSFRKNVLDFERWHLHYGVAKSQAFRTYSTMLSMRTVIHLSHLGQRVGTLTRLISTTGKTPKPMTKAERDSAIRAANESMKGYEMI